MNRFAAPFVLALALLAALTAPAIAQEPASQRARYTITLPPGFELIEVAGIRAICEPADRPAIEATLSALPPTTRPTTMPADLSARLAQHRESAIAQLAKEYAVADLKALDAHADKLALDLQALQEFRPPLFYLCTSDAKLKTLLKNGQWTTPGIYYNKLADDVMFRETVPLTVEYPMDDTIVAVIIPEGQGPDAMQAKLKQLVDSTRAEVDRMVSGRGMFLVQAMFIDAVMREVIEPMKFPFEQQWLGVGLSGLTSADYAQPIIGSPRRELLLLISAELRHNPIRMSTIDLLHPAEKSSIKRQYVAAYADAYRRKSMRAAGKIVEQSREKIPALITSLREKPCATGEELLARIKEITGLDLSEDVKAR